MTRSKIAVSIPPHLLATARRAVRDERAASVSDYVSMALEEKAKLDDLGELLDEMLLASGGPLSRSERARAERELGIRATRKRPAARMVSPSMRGR